MFWKQENKIESIRNIFAKRNEPGHKRLSSMIWMRRIRRNKNKVMQLSPKIIEKLWIRERIKRM